MPVQKYQPTRFPVHIIGEKSCPLVQDEPWSRSCVKLSLALAQLSVCLCFQTATSRYYPYWGSSVVQAPRKHTCSLCGRSFSRAHGLHQHQAIHSGNYPYKCQFCGEGFISTTNRRRHVAKHTGIRDHKCTLCVCEFSCLWDLKRHIIRHHKDTVMSSE